MRRSSTTPLYQNIKAKQEKKHNWMTHKILETMQERLKQKDKNVCEYNRLDKSTIQIMKEVQESCIGNKENAQKLKLKKQKHNNQTYKKSVQRQNSSEQRKNIRKYFSKIQQEHQQK